MDHRQQKVGKSSGEIFHELEPGAGPLPGLLAALVHLFTFTSLNTGHKLFSAKSEIRDNLDLSANNSVERKTGPGCLPWK